jgi:hypothetical protein
MQPTCRRPPRLFRRLAPLALSGLFVLGLLGCEEPEVKKYEAARDKAAPDVTRLAKYNVPKGWTRKDPSKSPVLATYQITQGDKTAQFTITRLEGRAGGLIANIARWRGQVGFPKVDFKDVDKMMAEQKEIEKDMRTLMVDGEKTPYVDLKNPDATKTDADRILGVIAERGPVTWFFKIQGPASLVEEHKATFEAFVQSLKFGGTGAYDE